MWETAVLHQWLPQVAQATLRFPRRRPAQSAAGPCVFNFNEQQRKDLKQDALDIVSVFYIYLSYIYRYTHSSPISKTTTN